MLLIIALVVLGLLVVGLVISLGMTIVVNALNQAYQEQQVAKYLS